MHVGGTFLKQATTACFHTFCKSFTYYPLITLYSLGSWKALNKSRIRQAQCQIRLGNELEWWGGRDLEESSHDYLQGTTTLAWLERLEKTSEQTGQRDLCSHSALPKYKLKALLLHRFSVHHILKITFVSGSLCCKHHHRKSAILVFFFMYYFQFFCIKVKLYQYFSWTKDLQK